MFLQTKTQKMGIDDYLALEPEPEQALQTLMNKGMPADPLERVGELDKDDSSALQTLLKEPNFCASLRHLNETAKDLVKRELKARGISAKAFKELCDEIREAYNARIAAKEEQIQVAPHIVEASKKLLHSPNIIDEFKRALGRSGLVGEMEAAVLLLLILLTRKCTRPLHAIVKASSSSGKNFLAERLLDLFPERAYTALTSLSPKALNYMPNTLSGKILYIAEHIGGESADYSIRSFMSEGRLNTAYTSKSEETGKLETQVKVTEGPISVLSTTTKVDIHDENETRLIEINLDESKQQTRDILLAQAKQCQLGKPLYGLSKKRIAIWRQALGSIGADRVIIPFAADLVEKFSTDRVSARRAFQHFIGLIESSARLHAATRERHDGAIVATLQDLELVRSVYTQNASGVPNRLQCHYSYLRKELGKKAFTDTVTASKVAKILGVSNHAGRNILKSLVKFDLAEQHDESQGRRPGRWVLLDRLNF